MSYTRDINEVREGRWNCEQEKEELKRAYDKLVDEYNELLTKTSTQVAEAVKACESNNRMLIIENSMLKKHNRKLALKCTTIQSAGATDKVREYLEIANEWILEDKPQVVAQLDSLTKEVEFLNSEVIDKERIIIKQRREINQFGRALVSSERAKERRRKGNKSGGATGGFKY